VRRHAHQAEVVGREGGEDVGRDDEAVQRTRFDLVDEEKSRDHGDGADESGQRRPSWHRRQALQGRERARQRSEQ
jgi:hypothetical protein